MIFRQTSTGQKNCLHFVYTSFVEDRISKAGKLRKSHVQAVVDDLFERGLFGLHGQLVVVDRKPLFAAFVREKLPQKWSFSAGLQSWHSVHLPHDRRAKAKKRQGHDIPDVI